MEKHMKDHIYPIKRGSMYWFRCQVSGQPKRPDSRTDFPKDSLRARFTLATLMSPFCKNSNTSARYVAADDNHAPRFCPSASRLYWLAETAKVKFNMLFTTGGRASQFVTWYLLPQERDGQPDRCPA